MRILLGVVAVAWAMALFWPGAPGLLDGALGRMAAGPWTSAQEPQASGIYRTAQVGRGDLVTSVEAAGTLNALVVVDVGSQISGLVTDLFADFNSVVERGQVIARVDPEIYEARVAQAEAEVAMARTNVEIGNAQVEHARAEVESRDAMSASAEAETRRAAVALARARQELERRRPLADRRVISPGEWDRALNDVEAAEAQHSAARAAEKAQSAAARAARATLSTALAQVANARAQVQQREALLREARIDLERTFIRAPVTGTVVNRAVSGGQTLAASLQSPVLFTIAQDLSRMQVEASVVEADVSRFAAGQVVEFTVDAFPGDVFPGTVRQIRKAPHVVQNVVTYVVVIDADNPGELMLPGMTANIRVVVGERTDVLLVPNAALRFRPAQAAAAPAAPSVGASGAAGPAGRVFRLGPDGQPFAVTLRLGLTDGRMTEVLSGDLGEGDHVIMGRAAGADAVASPILARFRLR